MTYGHDPAEQPYSCFYCDAAVPTEAGLDEDLADTLGLEAGEHVCLECAERIRAGLVEEEVIEEGRHSEAEDKQ